MAVKINTVDGGLLAMKLFGIDSSYVIDITFNFPMKGAASVTMTRLLTPEEHEHAKRVLAEMHEEGLEAAGLK